MSIFSRIKGWFQMLLKSRAKEEFNILPITSPEMEYLVNYCASVYQGKPEWVDAEKGIKTINFAKSVCSETARLAMLATKINVDGSARAEWLQGQIESMYFLLRQWIEYAMAYGTVILKPSGETVKLYVPGQFEVTEQSGGKITGALFHNSATNENNTVFYTRMEYHRFENGAYVITNKCFKGNSPNSCDEPIDIALTPWAGLMEEARILNLDRPLFGVIRTPHANNVEIGSPLALPLISDALEELMDLDIAYSRNATEIDASQRIVLADEVMVAGSGTGNKVNRNIQEAQNRAEKIGLPKMVKMVHGTGQENYYQEINPELNTEMRLKGINALLSQIGYKIGFSNGYFVFNESSGIQTATGVEAEQQRTIQFIKDVRDQLESCMRDLIDALSSIADLYQLAPAGNYEVVFDFGDITYNRDEDRVRWWGYVQAGKIPAWFFFMKFEGMTKEEAKAMVAEAAPKTPTLFGGEE